jgi:hypothetical protein
MYSDAAWPSVAIAAKVVLLVVFVRNVPLFGTGYVAEEMNGLNSEACHCKCTLTED